MSAGYTAIPNYNYIGWFIGTGLNDEKAKAPGAFGYTGCGLGLTPGEGCGFDTYEQCVAYSKTRPPVEVTLTSSSGLGVWLKDLPNQYQDNVAGVKNPSWSVKLKGCSK